MADYIPSDDAGLISFAGAFNTAMNAVAVPDGETNNELGFSPAEKTALSSAANDLLAAVNALNTAKSASAAARVAKDAAAVELRSLLRSASNRIQSSTNTSDVVRSNFGITIRDTTPTAVAAPTTQPVLFVDTSRRLQHTIAFRDSASPLSKAKPQGVFGCEIYRKVGGTAPSSVAECQFVGLDSASPYIAEYGAESGGAMVHYLGRWATRSGLVGPTSDVISATVVA